MPYDFSEKVALVTGAGSGIGKATAIRFAKAGATVVVSDVNAETGAAAAAEINETGGQAKFISCDVSDGAAIEALISEVVSSFGRLDCAFNNAGVNPMLDQWEDDIFDKLLAINLRSIMTCLREEGKAMLTQGGGAIVNTASINGLVGNAAQPAYTASKHGVVGITKTAALQWAASGVRVNAICPGVVDTAMVAEVVKVPQFKEKIEAMTPMGRMARPEEIAAGVLWLCSDEASFVTGHSLVIDGGATV